MKKTIKETSYFIDRLLININSDNIDIAVESIHALGELQDDNALQPLIKLLKNTKLPSLRNAAALALSNFGNQNILPILLSLISNPKTINSRGTLVHTLQYYNCTNILPFLVDLVINGNFEVSYEALQAIENIDGEIDEKEYYSCLNKINNALKKIQSEEKHDILIDLKSIFTEN